MDQIATFINTRRAVSIAWNVPAYSYDNARANLQDLNKLLSFLYPLYDSESGGATAINQSPLMRIEFGNLIRNADTGGGLLGYVNGFTFDPDLEGGMFYGKPSGGAVDYEYLPKTFRLNTEFNILHEHSLGFERINSKDPGSRFKFRNKNIKHYNYPYLAFPDYPILRVAQILHGTKAVAVCFKSDIRLSPVFSALKSPVCHVRTLRAEGTPNVRREGILSPPLGY